MDRIRFNAGSCAAEIYWIAASTIPSPLFSLPSCDVVSPVVRSIRDRPNCNTKGQLHRE